MISADFNRVGQAVRMTVKGHAEYGEIGEDVVCAAVSGLFYALYGYVTVYKPDSLIAVSFDCGFADIACESDCLEVFKLVYVGLWQIANSYPEHVSVGGDGWISQ